MLTFLKNLKQKHAPKGSFKHNVMTLMTGTTFAQVLTVLAAPFLTRLYTPADFGIFALYLSILGILSVAACWRYELAVVLPEKDGDAFNLLALSAIICMGMSTLTSILVIFFRHWISALLGAPQLAPWLFLLPVSLLSTGLFQALNYWSTRRKQFRRLAARQMTLSIATSVTQLSAGTILHPGVGGLISGSVLGQVVATGKLMREIVREESGMFIKEINYDNMHSLFLRYKGFPQFSLWSGLCNTASVMLPALMLGYFFNPTVVGYFALGFRTLSLPMSIVGKAVAQAFFPQATQARREGRLAKVSLQVFVKLLRMSIVPFFLCAIAAPILFKYIFGNVWEPAGVYVRWLSPWLMMVFISSPISTLFLVLEKQKTGMLFDVVLLLSRFVTLFIGGIMNDPLLAIILYATTGTIIWLIICFWLNINAGNYFSVIFKEMTKIFVSASFYLLIPLVIAVFLNNEMLLLTSLIISACVFLFNEGASILRLAKTNV